MHFSALYLILLFGLICVFGLRNAEQVFTQTRSAPIGESASAMSGLERFAYAPRIDNGFYLARARINGLELELVVDTGARLVAISSAQAKAMGYELDKLPRDVSIITAGGEAVGSRVWLDEIAMGEIIVRNVEAVIIDNDLPHPLLGLSFLSRVASMEITSAGIVLRQ